MRRPQRSAHLGGGEAIRIQRHLRDQAAVWRHNRHLPHTRSWRRGRPRRPARIRRPASARRTGRSRTLRMSGKSLPSRPAAADVVTNTPHVGTSLISRLRKLNRVRRSFSACEGRRRVQQLAVRGGAARTRPPQNCAAAGRARLHDGSNLRCHDAEDVRWQAVAVVQARPCARLRRAAEHAADGLDAHAAGTVAHHDEPRERLAKVLPRARARIKESPASAQDCCARTVAQAAPQDSRGAHLHCLRLACAAALPSVRGPP